MLRLALQRRTVVDPGRTDWQCRRRYDEVSQRILLSFYCSASLHPTMEGAPRVLSNKKAIAFCFFVAFGGFFFGVGYSTTHHLKS
jgi:hypothetical protein